MKPLREIVRGLILAGLAVFTIIAGLSLALFENPARPAVRPPATGPVPSETLRILEATANPNAPATAETATSLPAGTATPCSRQQGWTAETTDAGVDLAALAASRGISLEALLQGNCLASAVGFHGGTLYLPAAATYTVTTCGRPAGWAAYVVRPGDTVFSLAVRSGLTVSQLASANCLPGTAISAGQALFLPPQALATTALTASLTASPSPSLTGSASPTVTAPAATNTLGPTLTGTATSSATSSASPPPTGSPTATNTAALASSSTPTPTATDTPTPTPTVTATPSPTPTDTSVPAAP